MCASRPWVFLSCLAALACDARPTSPTEAAGALDASFASPIPSPERNPITPAGVALGRALFYDPVLSSNGQVSCATCHEQRLAFSDGEALGTAGVSGRPLLRHSPALINLAWMDGYFWDGGGFDLESQAFGPLGHPDEMNLTLAELVQKLSDTDDYPALFEAAFDDGITLPNVVRALAQFERTLISDRAKYDAWRRGDAQLTAAEAAGFEVFDLHCSGCHAPPFFTDQRYRNNGLDTEFSEDHEQLAWARARITLDPADIGKHKVPTLRNVAVTAPYMHDGRFATIDDVLNHYRFGVLDSPTLDPALATDGLLGIALTETEVDDLAAFLSTLTDPHFLTRADLGPP
jgi:cytochrome c peroxidase